jgi:peptidoglycan hydrolase-like protein with peptidoglycan-binding domain
MKFITEIKRIKSLINIFENNEKIDTTVIIGDLIAYLLSQNKYNDFPSLVERNMTFDMLLDRLYEHSNIEKQVKNLYVSIGSEDFFDDNLDVQSLTNRIIEIFPNANLYLIKGYINALEFNLDKKSIDLIEDSAVSFFKLFTLDKFKIIGDHNVVGYSTLDIGEGFLENLKSIIYYYDEEEIIGKEDENLNKNKKDFIDLSIDEDSDFDTIYEFLSNIEKMIKSGNIYDTNLKNEYVGDVEIIQIALKFLDVPFSQSIEINGKFDDSTKRAVEDYQSQNSLLRDGIVNSEFLEEMLYDLKVKSFDDDDLAKFMGKLGVDLKSYTPDDIDLEELCDRIIDNIEGGYANEVHFMNAANNAKNSDIKQALLNSGETMFGIDRKNGPTMTEFWEVVDENSGWSDESADKEKWPHGYMGGDVEDELREYVYEWAIPTYEEFKNSKLDSEAKRLVDEDERLTTHFLYAVWNGVVFFNNFAKIVNSAVSQGIKDRDELWKVALDSRKNHSNGAISNTAPKIEKIANM